LETSSRNHSAQHRNYSCRSHTAARPWGVINARSLPAIRYSVRPSGGNGQETVSSDSLLFLHLLLCHLGISIYVARKLMPWKPLLRRVGTGLTPHTNHTSPRRLRIGRSASRFRRPSTAATEGAGGCGAIASGVTSGAWLDRVQPGPVAISTCCSLQERTVRRSRPQHQCPPYCPAPDPALGSCRT